MTTQSTINTFILEVTLIDPIKKIITQFENNEFRDCDIKWLNNKLATFTDISLKSLKLNIDLPKIESGILINEYTTKMYLGYFNTLLTLFKKINNA